MKKILLLVALILLFADAGFCCTIVSCSRNGKVFAAANEDDYTSTLYWNQHAQGGMWEYWFSLPGGYRIVHFRDKRLDAADRIFQSLNKQEIPDPKLKNFMKEIDAYINLVQGDTAKARSLYALASADQAAAYPGSYNRAKEMLTKIN